MKKINWKYALGEIIIVIIGITIAFWLNNWAEASKNREIAKQYLVNLSKDLQNDQLQLKNNAQVLKKYLKNIQKIQLELANKSLNQPDSVINWFFALGRPIDFIPNEATHQTLINSGDYKVITNLSLKSAIEQYYGNYKILLKDYERQDLFSQNYLSKFYMEKLNYDELKQGKMEIFRDNFSRNMLISLQGIFLIKLKSTENTIIKNQKLLQKLT